VSLITCKGRHNIRDVHCARMNLLQCASQLNVFLRSIAFASDRHEAKCSCNKCWNRRMLSKYEMSGHIAKHGFMPNYLLWHQHGEVQETTPVE
jgi:hypothetical protein